MDSGPVPFRLEGEVYRLVVPADGLLVCGWAAAGNWYALVPGSLDGPSQEAFYGLLADPWGPVGLRACWRLAHALARPVFGTEWWVAERLSATAEEHWEVFSAWSVGVGFDPSRAPAHRVCSGVLAWLRGSCQNETDLRRLEAQLYAPPRPVARAAGKAAPPGFTEQEQAAAWEKAFAELGGG